MSIGLESQLKQRKIKSKNWQELAELQELSYLDDLFD